MQRILVTGATGFIGARIAESLLAEGLPAGRQTDRPIKVRIAGRSASASRALVDAGAEYRRGDLEDAGFAASACAGVDAVVHCAGMAGVWGPYEAYWRANVLATRHLLDAAQAAGAQRFVNISSPSIYFAFRDQFDLREDQLPRRFSNAYARTKWEGEELVRERNGTGGLRTVSLRPRSVIGRGDQNVLPRLLRLHEAGKLVQVGRGDNVVDITTIGNLVDAVRLCLLAPESAMGETYNLSNGAPEGFWPFVDLVLRSAGFAPTPRRRVPYAVAMTAARANEFVRRVLRQKAEPTFLPVPVGILALSMTMDISKARARLGYAPRFTTEDGVREFILARRSAASPAVN